VKRIVLLGVNWLLALAVLSVGARATADDWPQRQGNPQHTGYTTDSPRPPYRLAWKHYFAEDEEKVHPQVQPVIYQGKVFVGTKQGRLWCFDATSGEVLWKSKQAQGPVLNTAACGGGRVVFSCLDGFVRALDAADGSLRWAVDGGIHGFSDAPCVAEGKVFIGSRAGTFYCIDLSTGKTVWQQDMGRYIFSSAAWSEGRVFVGTEDMVFHCLDATTGNELWKSPRLAGTTFKEFFPVVTGGKVLIRTVSNVDAFPVPLSQSYIADTSATGKWARVPEKTSDLFVKHLAENPIHQSLFAFDEKTGRVPFPVCHNAGGTNDFHPALPAVDAQGRWYIAVTARGLDPNWWVSLMFVSIDPQSGRFVDFIWNDKPRKKGMWASTDEQEDFSIGGHILFIAQQEEGEAGHWGAFDLKTTQYIPIPSSMGWNQGLNYNQQQSGGHAFAISGNRFYHIAFHCLGCWQGSEEK